MKKIVLSVLIMSISLHLCASVFVFLIGPFKTELVRYELYFTSHYNNLHIFYAGQNLESFSKQYQTIINSSELEDTIIQIWAGHGGLTEHGKRGHGCFVLSDKMENDIDQGNELFCYDAIQVMAAWLVARYELRVVIILADCYAGLLSDKFPINNNITVLLSVSANQINFFWDGCSWFSRLLLKNLVNTKNSGYLIDSINQEYKDNMFIYNSLKIPSEREKFFGKAIDFYPLRAIHLGAYFNFK